MEHSIKRQQLVIAIQEFAKAEGKSAADIFRQAVEKGCDVSESTIRRIIKANPEEEKFSFEVLQRVSSALFDVNAMPLSAEKIDTPETAELEGLRAVSVLSDVALKEANGRIENLETELREAHQKIMQLTEIAEFRKQQMIVKDIQIQSLLRLLERNEMQIL